MERAGRVLATSAAGLFLQSLFLLFSGALLAIHYMPTLAGAHASSMSFQGGGLWSALDRYHYWGSFVLLVHGSIHLAVMLWLGLYKPPHQWRWIAALTVVACGLGFQITGNLLPMDRHGVQSAVIESSIASRIPLVGTDLRSLILGGDAFSQQTLSTWYGVHKWLLPLLLVLGCIGSLVTLFRQRDWSPSQIGAAFPLLVALGLCAGFAVPTGPASTPMDFNSYDTGPNWYTWPLHGLLTMFNSVGTNLGWIGSALIPGLFAVFLVTLPWSSRRISDGAARLLFLVFMATIALAAAVFAGPFPSPTRRQDPKGHSTASSTQSRFIDRKLANNGKKLFDEVGCGNCHGIDGSKGTIGPDLTKEYLRQSDRAWYVQFILNPSAVRKGSTMPSFPELTVYQRTALGEYLRHPPDVRNSR